MSDASTLIDLLDRLGSLVTEDRDLTTKAFGILLLGKKFTDEEEEETDPTELILKGGVRAPKL